MSPYTCLSVVPAKSRSYTGKSPHFAWTNGFTERDSPGRSRLIDRPGSNEQVCVSGVDPAFFPLNIQSFHLFDEGCALHGQKARGVGNDPFRLPQRSRYILAFNFCEMLLTVGAPTIQGARLTGAARPPHKHGRASWRERGGQSG